LRENSLGWAQKLTALLNSRGSYAFGTALLLCVLATFHQLGLTDFTTGRSAFFSLKATIERERLIV